MLLTVALAMVLHAPGESNSLAPRVVPFQFSFAVWHWPERAEVRGLRLGLGLSIGEAVTGLDLGLFNLASTLTGLQVGLFNFLWSFGSYPTLHGVQLGGVNATEVLWGAQLGLVNEAKRGGGVQVGLVNVAAGDFHGVQVGLINIMSKGPVVFFPFVNARW